MIELSTCSHAVSLSDPKCTHGHHLKEQHQDSTHCSTPQRPRTQDIDQHVTWLTKIMINSPRAPTTCWACTERFMHHDDPLTQEQLMLL